MCFYRAAVFARNFLVNFVAVLLWQELRRDPLAGIDAQLRALHELRVADPLAFIGEQFVLRRVVGYVNDFARVKLGLRLARVRVIVGECFIRLFRILSGASPEPRENGTGVRHIWKLADADKALPFRDKRANEFCDSSGVLNGLLGLLGRLWCPDPLHLLRHTYRSILAAPLRMTSGLTPAKLHTRKKSALFPVRNRLALSASKPCFGPITCFARVIPASSKACLMTAHHSAASSWDVEL